MEISDLPDGLPFDLLRRVIAEECSDNVKNIKLFYNKSLIKSGVTPKRLFKDLSVVPEIECRFKHPSQTTKINLGRRICKLSRADDISVYIYKGEETYKDKQPDNLEVNLKNDDIDRSPHIVQIEWVSDEPRKPFLGGYRRKVDKAIFHNASSQTFPKSSKFSKMSLSSRETQTYEVKHEEQGTLEQASTAMSRPGFYIASINDKVITPRPYEAAEEYQARLNLCAIIIQRNVRRWLANRRVARLRKLRYEYDHFNKEVTERHIQEKAASSIIDFERRAYPKSRYDIDRLFDSLEKWRVSELDKKYENSATVVISKANMGALIDKEIDFINNITRKQIELSQYGKTQEQEHLIKKAASTTRWTASHNLELVEKDTPNAFIAKYLLTLYENLKCGHLNKTERMDLLLTIKKLVGKHPSALSCDIVALAERETELMLRNIPSFMLTGLRQRILQRFIQFCKKPEYNPTVIPHLPISDYSDSNSRSKLWNDTHRCISCGQYLRTKKFDVSARAKHLGVCLFCWRQGNRGRDRLDLEPYRIILQELRQSEAQLIRKTYNTMQADLIRAKLSILDDAVEDQKRRRKDSSYVPFGGRPSFKPEIPKALVKIEEISDRLELLVNVQDIFYLVNKVWDGHSALSGCSQLGDLRFCRWKVTQPWSPWNTLLLTKQEAEIHMQLKDIPLTELYAETMLTRVRQRLVIGKNVFLRLCTIGHHLTKEQLKFMEIFRQPGDNNEHRQLRRQPQKYDDRPLHLISVEERHRVNTQPPPTLSLIRGTTDTKGL